jgi:hypothetical protein
LIRRRDANTTAEKSFIEAFEYWFYDRNHEIDCKTDFLSSKMLKPPISEMLINNKSICSNAIPKTK